MEIMHPVSRFLICNICIYNKFIPPILVRTLISMEFKEKCITFCEKKIIYCKQFFFFKNYTLNNNIFFRERRLIRCSFFHSFCYFLCTCFVRKKLYPIAIFFQVWLRIKHNSKRLCSLNMYFLCHILFNRRWVLTFESFRFFWKWTDIFFHIHFLNLLSGHIKFIKWF